LCRWFTPVSEMCPLSATGMLSRAHRFPKVQWFWKVPRLRPFVLLVQHVDEVSMEHWWNDTDRGKLKYWEKKHYTVLVVDGWMSMGIGGMILTGGNLNYWRETCPSGTLSTTNLIWTDLGPKTEFLVEGNVFLIQETQLISYILLFHVDNIYSTVAMNLISQIIFIK
jgi:hypothetical protein